MGDVLDLWRRIASFDLDGDAHPGYFVEKLAYENGWSRSFAERVVDEYRRYLYLACTAEHVVVPSDQVDMAWHQHLLDTEQYWGMFCKTVLNRPLHHRPSKGGCTGEVDHVELYERTLQTYAEAFGCEPPEDIWPPSSRRFGRESAHRRIAQTHNWIVPKRRVRVIGGATAITLAAPALVAWARPSAEVPMVFGITDFGWNDYQVLVTLVLSSVAAVIVAYALRRVLLGTDAGSEGESANVALDPYEVAVLNTNTQRAVNVAVAALVRDEAVGFDESAMTSRPNKYRLVRTGPLPTRAHPLERAIYAGVTSAGSALVSDVHDWVRPDSKRILESLRERELLRPHPYIGRRWAIASPIMLVCIIGGAGALTTGATVTGFIVLLIIVLLIVAIVMAGAPPQLTDRGCDALEFNRTNHSPMTHVERDDVADGRALSWVIALQGADVLGGGAMSVLRDAINAPASSGGGGQGVKSAGCGGGVEYSRGRGGGGGSGGSGCGGSGCGDGGCGGGGE
jgi:uncharacterized protein (TIGR04222 family)